MLLRAQPFEISKQEKGVTDPEGNVLLVIEHQGAGHYGKGDAARARAEANDRTKREALASAGIPLVEIPAKLGRAMVLDMVRAKVSQAAERPQPARRSTSGS